MPEELVPRDEARAALAARRELGDDFDDALVEAFAGRIEERLHTRRPAMKPNEERGMSLALAIVSVACGIPITAIAISGAGVPALVVAWAGIVLVNVLFARLR
jgi:hypothetical protein